MNEEAIQKAIADLELVRRSIQQATQPTEKRGGYSYSLLIQAAAFAMALIMLLFEVFTDNSQTELLLVSRHLAYLQYVGVINVGLLLVLLGFIFMLIVQHAAKSNEQPLLEYIGDNFTYLKNFSLFSDLVIKFFIFSLVIFARVPELVSPLLTIFVADYLFQGRLFELPYRLSLILGFFCVIVASLQFFCELPHLLLPLGVFCAISLLSFGHIYRLRKISGEEK